MVTRNCIQIYASFHCTKDLLILEENHVVVKDGTDSSLKPREVARVSHEQCWKNIAIELLKLILGFIIFHWSLTFDKNSAL